MIGYAYQDRNQPFGYMVRINDLPGTGTSRGKGRIEFADSGKYGGKKHYDLLNLAQANQKIFEGKIVHFDSCSTLCMDDYKIEDFKKMTGALLVTGYKRSVGMTESFIFEAWLLNTLYKHPDFRAKRLLDLAHKEMQFYVEKFRFVAY